MKTHLVFRTWVDLEHILAITMPRLFQDTDVPYTHTTHSVLISIEMMFRDSPVRVVAAETLTLSKGAPANASLDAMHADAVEVYNELLRAWELAR